MLLSCFVLDVEESQTDPILTLAVIDGCFGHQGEARERRKQGERKQWRCLGKRAGEKMERTEGQQEGSQNIEENIPEAKNSFLRHSPIQSLGLHRVDSGTEERWEPRAVRVHLTEVVCREDKGEIN